MLRELRPLDPRAWLLWAIAASMPPLVGRNPWPLAATLLAVLGVWGVWGATGAGARWRPLLRLALLFGVISVLFNLMTAHVGDLVLLQLPANWPIVGGVLTVNAFIFGLLSALAIFTLVVVGITLGAVLDWTLIIRLLPERMAPLAVAGSVAWSYLPRTTVALQEIREAQAARGFRPRGVRDAPPLIVPLLAGGLERSLITAEALEARAFGAPLAASGQPRPWQMAIWLLCLVAATTGAFCLALGLTVAAVALLVTSLGVACLGTVLGRHPKGVLRRTRYRDPIWERSEWVVSGTAVLVLMVEVLVLVRDPAAFRYEPYPSLTPPSISLPLLAALGLLLTPAVILAPQSRSESAA